MNTANGSFRRWVWRKAAALVLSLVIGTAVAAPAFHTVIAQSDVHSSFHVTLEELGYGERVLSSPWGSTQYSFRLPSNWLVEEGSYLDFELGYFFTEAEQGEGTVARQFFGDLMFYLDDQLLQVYSLNAPALEHIHLRVDIPSNVLNDGASTYHNIRLKLDAAFLCGVLHKAQLIVYPESLLSLNYSLTPYTLDLSDYPRPFYQRSFEPDQVRFVLPAQPSEVELRAAAGIAAKLGDLTSGIDIAVTSDASWLRDVSSGLNGSEHLLVIGQPDRNELVAWLGENVALPIPIHRREMSMSTRGPAFIAPGDTFSYTVTVTNTASISLTSLVLVDNCPLGTEMVECDPACTEAGDNQVRWQLGPLSPGAATRFYLTLRLTDLESSQPGLLENLAALQGKNEELWNTSYLATELGPTGSEGQTTSIGQGEYFFVQGERPVVDGDGVLQEIVSPWDSNKVALLVTGATEEAVYKAAQSLSLDTSFPDLKGPAGLIREIRYSPPPTETISSEHTLADLGYTDRTVYGMYGQELTYWFPVPLGWSLTDGAYFRLLFGHSAAVDEQVSTLTVLLNDIPWASVSLDESNAIGGVLELDLPDSRIKRGTSNEISIQSWMQVSKDQCERIDVEQVWLNVSQDSLLHLEHREQGTSVLDLDYFPFPFNTRPDLSDVLFALPSLPEAAELESMLRVAYVLGSSAIGDGFRPTVSLREETPDAESLSRYHVVAIGRPSANSLIRQINPLLPQPFVPGADQVEHQIGEVLLRLPPDLSLGYIQEIPSPWNEERALLAVTGTTDEGLEWAAYALSQRYWNLAENLVLVREGEDKVDIQSIDTRGLTNSGIVSEMAAAVPELTPVVTATVTVEAGEGDGTVTQPTPSPGEPGASSGGLPTWVMLVVGVTVATVAIIFVTAVRKSKLR